MFLLLTWKERSEYDGQLRTFSLCIIIIIATEVFTYFSQLLNSNRPENTSVFRP